MSMVTVDASVEGEKHRKFPIEILKTGTWTRSTHSTSKSSKRQTIFLKKARKMTDRQDASAGDHHDDDHLSMPLSPSLRSHPDDWINMLPFDDADLQGGSPCPTAGGEHVGLSVSVGSDGLHHPHGGGGGGSNFHLGGQQQHDAHAQQQQRAQRLDDEMMAAAVAAAVAATSTSTTHAAGAAQAGPKTTGEEDYNGYSHSDHSGLDMHVTPEAAAAATTILAAAAASPTLTAAAGTTTQQQQPAAACTATARQQKQTQKAITSAARAQARSERKRSREKQRRSDVNAQFAGLTAVLRKIETDEARRRAEREEREEARQRAARKMRQQGGQQANISTDASNTNTEGEGEPPSSSSTTAAPAAAGGADLGLLDQIGRTGCPTNRADLIAKTVAVLERLHLGNARLTEEVEELREEVERQRKAGEELAARHKGGHTNQQHLQKQPYLPPPPGMMGCGGGQQQQQQDTMNGMMMQKQQEKVCFVCLMFLLIYRILSSCFSNMLYFHISPFLPTTTFSS